VATIVIEEVINPKKIEVIIHTKEGASYLWKQICIPMVRFQEDAYTGSSYK
jgi:hypothetical protein